MNVYHRPQFIGDFIQFPEALIRKSYAIDVAEDHSSPEFQLLHGPAQLRHGCMWNIERQCSQGHIAAFFVCDHAGKDIVHLAGQPHRGRWLLYMCARRSESNDLGIYTGIFQYLLAVIDVAMPANGHVVITGIMQLRIAFRIVGDAYGAGSLLQGLDVLRWIVMIVKVNDGHRQPLPSVVGVTRQSTRAALKEASPGQTCCHGDWLSTD